MGAFINRKLNRFGRGSAALAYFGNMIEIESFQVGLRAGISLTVGRHLCVDTFLSWVGDCLAFSSVLWEHSLTKCSHVFARSPYYQSQSRLHLRLMDSRIV